MTEPAGVAQYATMQRTYYDTLGKDKPETVVGRYGFNENFPYETQLLYKFGDIRKPIFPDFKSRRAFDICCGEGRMVRRMNKLFAQVDGADISAEMITHARQRTPGSQFWVTSGANAGDAPTATYDFVYCTISLQHICVFTIRDSITQDLKRILKPNGKMTLQYLYGNRYPLVPVDQPTERDGAWTQTWRRDTRHALWEDDKTNAKSTNSSCDVVIGQDELGKVRAYFLRHFEEVEFWFWDISIARPEPASPQASWGETDVLSRYHPNSLLDTRYWGTHFIFIHCSKPKP